MVLPTEDLVCRSRLVGHPVGAVNSPSPVAVSNPGGSVVTADSTGEYGLGAGRMMTAKFDVNSIGN